MKDTKFRILLDIHEVRSQATIPVKVGDVSCKIYITLVEGGKPYKIHENSFGVFTGKKGDDKHLFNNCVIENGIIRYDFTPQTVAAAGVLECEVRIYDEDGGVLTTPSFNIIVDERAVNDSELASSDEFSFLDEILVNEGQRIQNEKNRNEAFNNLGIDLEDDGEVISIVKTDIDGSQEKSTFLKYADVIPPVTASASGSAITIDSAKAPLQNLKLFGKTEQNGTPTPEAPVPLVSVGDSGSFEFLMYGKNSFDIGLKSDYFLTYNDGRTLLLTQNISDITTFSITDNTINIESYNNNGYKWISKWIKLIPNTDYTISIENIGGLISVVGLNSNENGTIGEALINKNQVSNTVKAVNFNSGNYKYYIISFYLSNVGVTFKNIQVELGTQATPYEEFKGKKSLTIPYTLRSVGDIKDEVDFENGYIIRRIGVVDLGTLNWQRSMATNGTPFFMTMDIKTETFQGSATEKSKCLVANYQSLSPNEFTGELKDGTCMISAQNGNFLIIDDRYTTATEFKNAMSGVILQYALATPTETPLTETELNAYRHLMTNKGTTTVLSECEDTEITYYINKPNAQAIGNIHSQVNEDYFKLQQAIISLGGN